jgi:hypothetical protein
MRWGGDKHLGVVALFLYTPLLEHAFHSDDNIQLPWPDLMAFQLGTQNSSALSLLSILAPAYIH